MEYKSNCNYYKILALAILLLGFILGIVFGSVFSTDAVSGYSEETVEIFNCTLMLSTWFSSFILSVFILGIYSICIRLDAIAGNTNKGKKSRASQNTSIHEEIKEKDEKIKEKDEEIKEKDEEIKEKDEENKKFIWE